ncbi:MAG: Unknown protein [uncultured Thiotrichaceae bacterium]|uniref:DUF4234 domain-containing protein n=1 Tax=uncultured Thiotrichaceae bacterium TaxID=298394 RepID=A0A6S6S7F3_9GAMM|nr:MAG: Unknown protein [uncultured Thiotrichaceae bacterium]
MKNKGLISLLKGQGTGMLLLLGVISYGLYWAYYARSQTKKINAEVDDSLKISPFFVHTLFVMSHLSFVFFLLYILSGEAASNNIMGSQFVDIIRTLMLVLWGLLARDAVNAHCEIKTTDEDWFSGPLSFFFSPLYFNYKVDLLNEKYKEQNDDDDSSSDAKFF